MKSASVFDDFYRTLEVTLQEIPVVIDNEFDGTLKELTYRCGALDLDIEDASDDGNGIRFVMAELRSASGHRFNAILKVCFVPDSGRGYRYGQHLGTRIVVPGPDFGRISVLEQGTPDYSWYFERLEREMADFKLAEFSYRYLDKSRYERDEYVDSETGWSY